jgi:large subunit ribosomal protein L10e
MGLRPARTFRSAYTQAWSRTSQAKPRKSYIKGAPHAKVRQYDMGVLKGYEVEADLVADIDIQVRDNAIEAARLIVNKFLEKNLAGNYYFKIRKYPHIVLREHTSLGVAGADRISKGMKLAFGRPKGRLVRVHAGEILFSVRAARNALPVVREALGRARAKISGAYHTTFRELSEEEKAISVVKEFKKIEEPKPEAAAAAAPAAGEAKLAEEEKKK